MEWENQGTLLISMNNLFHLEIEDLGISNAKLNSSHFSFKFVSCVTRGWLEITLPSFLFLCS